MTAFKFQPGDIAACYGTGALALSIRLATAAVVGPPRLMLGPSHVAIVTETDHGPLWCESTTLSSRPCVVRGERVAGCQAHAPMDRVQEYATAGGRVDVYRLTAINALSQPERKLMTRILLEHFVRPGLQYDAAGAVLSGTRLLQATSLFPDAGLHTMFCSELIAAVLMRLNRLSRDNPSRFNPSRLLRRLVANGTYQFVCDFP